jgi:hypothetical protein
MAFSSILARFKALFGEANSSTFVVEDEIKRAYEKTISVNLDPSTNAAVNTTKRHVFYAYRNVTVTAAKYVPDGACALNSANYANIALFAGNGTAAAATVVGSVVTTSAGGNMVAGTPYALSLTAANCDVDAGETLAAQIVKASSGVAVPKGALVIHYIER